MIATTRIIIVARNNLGQGDNKTNFVWMWWDNLYIYDCERCTTTNIKQKCVKQQHNVSYVGY